ncbi:MAG: HypC/HybG/HupF family hydrogenase formation chaperone [Propionibacteriaceae bacterium]|nr:HypC/HybG/HupF family hydrogenase formation chaperone [Propionibacteriaceae bacterium]
MDDQPECTDDYCITCSDDARAGILISKRTKYFMPTGEGVVRTDDGDEKVDLSLVPGASVGDRLLVHAGVAIAALEPEEDK